jgi:hypothetical protein
MWQWRPRGRALWPGGAASQGFGNHIAHAIMNKVRGGARAGLRTYRAAMNTMTRAENRVSQKSVTKLSCYTTRISE